MDGLFKQACSIRFNRAAMGGSLTGKLCLDLGLDVNSDRH
jgi:hypothetical protein